MRTLSRTCPVLLGICLLGPPAFAFQVTLDSGVGSLTIVDNDTNDLNANVGEIEFSQTVGGIFSADGRAVEFFGPIFRSVEMGTRTAGGDGVFANLDSAAHAFTVTVESDAFSAPGPALGWGVFNGGLAEDATPDDVEIPTNDVDLRADPGNVLLGTASSPVTPAVPPSGQPVSLGAHVRGVDPTGDATQIRITWSMSLGPNDRIRLPDPNMVLESVIFGAVFNAEDRCVFVMNKRAFKVAKLAGIDDFKCVKAASSSGGNATACVEDQASPKTADAEDRLLADFDTFCSIPPAFATNLGTCCEGGTNDGDPCSGPSDCSGGSCIAGACISGAAEDAAVAVAHDLFGPTVGVDSGITGRCQTLISKMAGLVHAERWKALFRCKQQTIASLTSEADFVATCLGPPQAPSANFGRQELKLADKIQRRCLDDGVTGLATVFPGACASEPDGAYAACINRRIACRFCLGAIVADDIASPLDCDVFDDGASNGSCP